MSESGYDTAEDELAGIGEEAAGGLVRLWNPQLACYTTIAEEGAEYNNVRSFEGMSSQAEDEDDEVDVANIRTQDKQDGVDEINHTLCGDNDDMFDDKIL